MSCIAEKKNNNNLVPALRYIPTCNGFFLGPCYTLSTNLSEVVVIP